MKNKLICILALLLATALVFSVMPGQSGIISADAPPQVQQDAPAEEVSVDASAPPSPPSHEPVTPPAENSPAPDAPKYETVSTERTLSSYFGSITATDTTESSEHGVRSERTYTFFDGDVFCSGRITTGDAQPALFHVSKLSLSGSTGTVKHYDGEKWNTVPLEDGTLGPGMYFISTDLEQMIICLPLAYRPIENSMLEEIVDFKSKLFVSHQDDKWDFEVYAQRTDQGVYIEYMYVLSSGELIDWTRSDAASDWAGFLFTGDSRWTYDGYYYSAPVNYIPSGDNCFHRLSAAYISTKFIDRSEDYRAARIMGLAMMDVMCGLQNEQGFFPTLAGSQWLLDDYDIGPDFFDTRFNTDLVTAMITAITDLGAQWLEPTVARFCDFYMQWLDAWAINRNGKLLAPDYWDADGCRVTHISLNHQLAEALMLLKLFRLYGSEEYLTTALALIEGLTDKTDFWLCGPGGDLHYGWYAGSPIGSDYPYLTYNDLFKLNNELYLITGRRNSDLDRLIAHKMAWMLKNGVTGYMK